MMLLRFLRAASCALLLSACCLLPSAHAVNVSEVARQLAEAPVVHGEFVQEKYLRGLPRPLSSTGRFVMDRTHGLLWQLETPIRQEYRIVPRGIDQRGSGGWQPLRHQVGLAQQSRLFIALMQGDQTALERDFSLTLTGSLQAWQLEMVPRSGLLKQIFDTVRIEGGRFVERIELRESQGDRTLLRMTGSTGEGSLSVQEALDLGL